MTDDPAAALEAAISLAQKGALVDAERLLRELLERDPSFARAYNALGVVQLQLGDLDAAEFSLLNALRLAPGDPRVHINLGNLYGIQRRAANAGRHLHEAVRLDPGNATASFNLAAYLRDQGRVDEAETEFKRAVALDPRDAEAQCNLARLLLEKHGFAEAERYFRQALELRPDAAVAHNDLALVLLETGRLAEAQQSCREAVRIAPGYLRAWSNFVMCGQYDPGATDADLFARAKQAGEAAQAAARSFADPLASAAMQENPSIGLVSGDLHHHPVGLFLLPLLRELHGRGVKVALYSNGGTFDGISQQLSRCAEWIDIAGRSDDEAWSRIRADRPDVLIDLAGHTGNNRLAVFAGRAAPLQVSWLGYFATTGTPNMDGALMDPWHAPPGCESQFSEKLLRLPHTRFCYQPIDGAPDAAPRPPAAQRGYVTFGSFNSIAKVNDGVIGAWSRVLRDTPGSRLVLKWRSLADAPFRAGLAARFRDAGIDPARIELRPASDHAGVLGQYADIDIALDTFPFTGGQTSFEALWMGVPVVTRAGHRPVSRQTLCALGNLGLDEELAAHDDKDGEDGFVARATALARDLPRLESLRTSLRPRMMASPLMQAAGFSNAFLGVLRSAADSV
jgi:predicted O-linked N-acetylglucosamine transferase (SPINDLY family)